MRNLKTRLGPLVGAAMLAALALVGCADSADDGGADGGAGDAPADEYHARAFALGPDDRLVLGEQVVLADEDETVSRIAQLDAAGELDWEVESTRASCLAVSDHGQIFVVGWDDLLESYDATGELLWQQPLPSSYSVGGGAVDPDGNLVITGATGGLAWGWDVIIARYDPGGELLLEQELGTPRDDAGGAVAVDGDGNIWIAGGTKGDFDDPDYAGTYARAFVAKLDGDAEPLWIAQREFVVDTHTYSFGASSLAIDSAGSAIAGCRRNEGDDSWDHIWKVDGAGDEAWLIDGPFCNKFVNADVAVDGSGDIYFTSCANNDASLTKYDADGEELWTALWAEADYALPVGVATGVDDLIYVAGNDFWVVDDAYEEYPITWIQPFVTAFDPDGEQLWIEHLGNAAE